MTIFYFCYEQVYIESLINFHNNINFTMDKDNQNLPQIILPINGNDEEEEAKHPSESQEQSNSKDMSSNQPEGVRNLHNHFGTFLSLTL